MDLVDFVDYYIQNHDLSEGYETQLKTHVRLFMQSIGRVDIANVTAEHVNAALKRMRHDGRSDSYMQSHRTHLLVFLREAMRRGEAPEFRPDEVMRVRVKDRITRGYTPAEMLSLLSAAWDLPRYRPYYHKMTGCVRRDWWVSFLMARWDTGCDTDTLLSLEYSWIPPNGWLTVVRPKSGKRVRIGFHAATIKAIETNMESTTRVKIWPLWGTKRAMDGEFERIRKEAEVGGSLKHTRSGSGTAFEAAYPGRGHEHLGNTRRVFEQNYLVAEQAYAKIDLPTPLIDATRTLAEQLSDVGKNRKRDVG